PSVNGVHAERAVVDVIASFVQRHGLEFEVAGRDNNRPNIIIKSGPSSEAALLMIAHTDTVAAGSKETWTYSPFAAEVVGGRLYGRGAADNKGGIAAAIAALLMLRNADHNTVKPSAWLVCVPDEEAGASGELGVRYLREAGKLSGQG